MSDLDPKKSPRSLSSLDLIVVGLVAALVFSIGLPAVTSLIGLG
jgi:hypothetical protein